MIKSGQKQQNFLTSEKMAYRESLNPPPLSLSQQINTYTHEQFIYLEKELWTEWAPSAQGIERLHKKRQERQRHSKTQTSPAQWPVEGRGITEGPGHRFSALGHRKEAML